MCGREPLGSLRASPLPTARCLDQPGHVRQLTGVEIILAGVALCKLVACRGTRRQCGDDGQRLLAGGQVGVGRLSLMAGSAQMSNRSSARWNATHSSRPNESIAATDSGLAPPYSAPSAQAHPGRAPVFAMAIAIA